MALAALVQKNTGSRRGVAYCGICHTEQHADKVRAYLTSRVFKCTQDEGSELCTSRRFWRR
eukprot:2365113-Lingulodinium_polyedra.AAC.1